MNSYLDLGSKLVIALTFILFGAAIFTSGITHALFLESGVLLVSIKLIMINHKNRLTNQKIIKKLDEINNKLNLEK